MPCAVASAAQPDCLEQSDARAFVADWLDVGAYPDEATSLGELAWNFLRRNAHFAENWQQLVQAAAIGASDGELAQLNDELALRWGLRAMVDPWRSEPPIWRIDWPSLTVSDGRSRDTEVQRIVSVVIDLEQPINRQLTDARALLRPLSKAWTERAADDEQCATRIQRRQIYLECLRVADAVNQSIPQSVIGATLWPNYCVSRNTIRYRARRAVELIEHGYRDLVIAEANAQRVSNMRVIKDHTLVYSYVRELIGVA